MELVSLPFAADVTIVSAATQATGTNYTTLPTAACRSVEIVNTTGTDLEYRRNGTGTAMPIISGASRLIIGVSNANQIQVRRKDTSNTVVTVFGEVFS